jgi:hypothetical protein
MVDRATNRSRGFGFITFGSELSINEVMRQGHEIKGKAVEIKRAEPRNTTRSATEGMGRTGPRGGQGGGGMRDGYGMSPYGGGAGFGPPGVRNVRCDRSRCLPVGFAVDLIVVV